MELKVKEVSYKKLWHILIDRNMRKIDLKKATGMSSSTLARMVAGQPVNVEVLLRVCTALDCDFCDIMEAVPKKLHEDKSQFSFSVIAEGQEDESGEDEE